MVRSAACFPVCEAKEDWYCKGLLDPRFQVKVVVGVLFFVFLHLFNACLSDTVFFFLFRKCASVASYLTLLHSILIATKCLDYVSHSSKS